MQYYDDEVVECELPDRECRSLDVQDRRRRRIPRLYEEKKHFVSNEHSSLPLEYPRIPEDDQIDIFTTDAKAKTKDGFDWPYPSFLASPSPTDQVDQTPQEEFLDFHTRNPMVQDSQLEKEIERSNSGHPYCSLPTEWPGEKYRSLPETQTQEIAEGMTDDHFESPGPSNEQQYSSLSTYQPGSHRNNKSRRMPLRSKSCSDVSDQQQLQQKIDCLYENYTQCRECSSPDVSSVLDTDGKIMMKECQSCGGSFGFDDMISPDFVHFVHELYQKGFLEFSVGCCNNKDPDQFQIISKEGSQIEVECMKCDKVSYVQLKDEEDMHCTQDLQPDVLGETDDCRSGSSEFQFQYEGPGDGKRDEARCLSKNTSKTKTLPDQPIDVASDSSTIDKDLVSCKCADHEKNIKVVQGLDGDIEIIVCSNCNFQHLPKDPNFARRGSRRHQRQPAKLRTSHSLSGIEDAFRGGKDKRPEPLCTEIQRISELRRGNHIFWQRNLGYDHHAIIDWVYAKESRIVVIHYTGPGKVGKVQRQEIDPFSSPSERLFRLDHYNRLPVDEIIKRAKSRIGEESYNFAFNNCEHFATWCQIGEHSSSQVHKVIDTFKKYAGACSPMAKQLLKKLGGPDVMAAGGGGGAGGALAKIPLTLARGSKHAPVFLLAGQEIKGCVQDIQKAAKDRKQGRLSRGAFIEVVVSRAARSIGGLAGMALGMRIPIPIKGPLVGGTVGGAIGEYAGKQAGKFIAKATEEIGAAYGAKLAK